MLIEAVSLWESIAGVLMEIRTFPDGNPLLVEPVAHTDPWPCSKMVLGVIFSLKSDCCWQWMLVTADGCCS